MGTDIEMPDASKEKELTKEVSKESNKSDTVDPLDAVVDGTCFKRNVAKRG